MKKIAIHFFGHMRTYQATYKSFFNNFIKPNLSYASMDLFIHTWDEYQTQYSRHQSRVYASMESKKLSSECINDIKNIYKPIKIKIDTYDPKLGHGMYISVKRVNQIRREHEKNANIKYDYYIYTRPDILFINQFKFSDYIDFYLDFHKDKLGIKEKITWCVNNYFRHLPFIDMRFVNEGDLCWINNFDCDVITPRFSSEYFVVPIRYICFKDFIILRELYQNVKFDPFVETKQSVLDDAKKLPELIQKINTLNLELQKSKESINTLNTEINSYPIKKQSLEISNLEQDLINKKLKAQILEKELGLDNEINLKYNNALQENENLKAQLSKLNQEFETNNPKSKSANQRLQKINADLYFALNYGTAKSRIKNQLTYKLGQAMIANSKSIWGYIRMPYVLSYIKDIHKKEQIAYNEKIKANPSLKLPPLESYPDYNEAIKIKEHLSYKLGEALINADKSKLKLGYLTLWFKCKKITKEHKDNHKHSPNNPNH
ncbi:hypothetical protein V2I22_02805 [Campylobacter sp. CLAX-7218-21]|uniref:hypothetical protein n=1 Tax=Campylobacter devanensis TaxID=3161138 RepID=UPI002EB435DE|nr:hypothetical protein [Campylobacter sp. CLAX-7218-21]